MKILAISCSPREKGNTVTLLEEALSGAIENGADIEFYSVVGKNLNGCEGCGACRKSGKCKIKDDMPALHEKMLEADGIIFGAPIYYYGMCSQAKTVVDRTYCLNQPGRSLVNKVGGIVTVAGSLGLIDALKDFYFFFAVRQMLPANYVAVYAGGAGDVKEKEKSMIAAADLGRQMAELARVGFQYPPEYPSRPFAFGTHTH